MESQMGLAHFWGQGDLVTHTTAVILALLSLASWSVIVSKLLSLWRASRLQERALNGFWNADSLPEALEGLRRDDVSGVFSGLALTGAHAAQAHQQNAARGIGAGVNASEFVTRAMRPHIVNTQARNERGLTFLASVGSTAPFIGLFGTVWGIMHSFRGLANVGQATLSAVAPGIAEALVATAIGLFAAIPAVVAYNRFSHEIDRLATRFECFMEEFSNILQRQMR